ncbi:hypothetical protein [Streptomyces sp. SD31]|uniref:hypothetical protein n=1 Tax=Streptomyces sp. SD31 TaxID=3452208 RepID=UPI003F89582C
MRAQPGPAGAEKVSGLCLGALLEDVTGISEGLVPAVLCLYGVGAPVGLTVGDRIADRVPFGGLLTGMGAVAAVAATLTPTADIPAVVIPLAVLLAAGGFMTNPAVNARVFGLRGASRTLGGAVNIAAFDVGIAVAPWVSVLVIDAGPGRAGIGRVGAPFAVAAVPSTLLDRHLTRRHQRTTPTRAPAPALRDVPEYAAASR